MFDECQELITTGDCIDILYGVKNSLLRAKLLNAAKNELEAFINEVEAQREKKVSEEDADILINAAQSLIESINNIILQI